MEVQPPRQITAFMQLEQASSGAASGLARPSSIGRLNRGSSIEP
jgi:hypothetical protein